MKEIKIGTCVPGRFSLEWAPHLVNAGFEAISPNFHMELGGIDLAEYAKKMKDIVGDKAIIPTFGLFCNPLQNESHLAELKSVIDAAHLFGTDKVCTFAGAIEGESVEAAMPRFKEVFGELTKYAADKGVMILFENCPMNGTWNKATCNIAFNPKAWEMMFNEVPAENMGLEWEPAHQMGQLIDPLPNLKEWVHKIKHVHGKDATIEWDQIKKFGIVGHKNFVHMRTPGFGDTDWREVFFTLYQNGYEGTVCVEGYHDPIYGRDWEMTGQLHALEYLKWARGGNHTPNPWPKVEMGPPPEKKDENK